MDTEEEQSDKYPLKELTEILIGFSFDIYKQIGGRHPEKFYQNAFENKLKDNGIAYKREDYCKIEVDNRRIGFVKMDFVIKNQVVVEMKVRDTIYNKDIAQILSYLRINKKKVGLILLFSSRGVKVKRLVV